MKIKRKLEKNLPQLIEWVIENKKFGFTYVSDKFNKVYVTDDGIIEFNGSFYRDIFTIITFEEITEETEFKSMVEVTTDGLLDVWGNANISAWKDVHSKEFHAYIDGEFKLIWTHEKGLVE
ncbi:MAG: hypothetical protein ACTH27_06665 [Staphylococcus equorum]